MEEKFSPVSLFFFFSFFFFSIETNSKDWEVVSDFMNGRIRKGFSFHCFYTLNFNWIQVYGKIVFHPLSNFFSLSWFFLSVSVSFPPLFNPLIVHPTECDPVSFLRFFFLFSSTLFLQFFLPVWKIWREKKEEECLKKEFFLLPHLTLFEYNHTRFRYSQNCFWWKRFSSFFSFFSLFSFSFFFHSLLMETLQVQFTLRCTF